jgi:arylsulfatase A-like enzyme
MKAVLLMFDTLCRRYLPPYGNEWVKAPNFQRLAQRCVTFDNCYVGSMPCMPARREIHTGRYNFLHRSWGPLEPFDDSMPELLHQHGVLSHLATDHYHYWEDGGATYHNRYASYEFFRGQEGDRWMGQVADPTPPPSPSSRNFDPKSPAKFTNYWRQDWINREHTAKEEDMPQARSFKAGMDFIRHNAGQDKWLLHLETFDPHEPFFVPQKYLDLYPSDYAGRHFDWPDYDRVDQTPEEVQEIRRRYAALLSMCDAWLGKLLDLFDELDLWKDTLLIVNTDHGFLMGEHDWWAKCVQPFYQEIAHTPLFVWDPRSKVRGQRRKSLVQTIDLAPTILDYFGIQIPKDMQGRPLKETVVSDKPVREAVLFGIHGGQVNVTDGKHVYMRAPAKKENMPLYQYTWMPTHMRGFFVPEELKTGTMHPPFSFTKGLPVVRMETGWRKDWKTEFGTALYDVEKDPEQMKPLNDPVLEAEMVGKMKKLMKENDAPSEQYERLGI